MFETKFKSVRESPETCTCAILFNVLKHIVNTRLFYHIRLYPNKALTWSCKIYGYTYIKCTINIEQCIIYYNVIQVIFCDHNIRNTYISKFRLFTF